MWSRVQLKRHARKTWKKNYMTAISICFIFAFFTGAYQTSIYAIQEYSTKKAMEVPAIQKTEKITPEDVFADFVHGIREQFHSETGTKDTKIGYAIEAVFNSSMTILVDGMTPSKDIIISALKIVNSTVGNNYSSNIGIVLAGVLLGILYTVYIGNILAVGEKRFFMENRKYKDTFFRKLFFLYHIRQIRGPAKVMFLRTIRQTLWSFTIVMWPVKYYEYAMIPYILAENPNTTAKEAFTLSKQLMKGQKWKAFLLDLSFLGWQILSIVTLGLVGIFYLNPYYASTWTELYMKLRKEAIKNRIPEANRMNDILLELDRDRI